MSTERLGVCQLGCHSEVVQTTAVNRQVSQSPCLYRYRIQSVCVQQGQQNGVQKVDTDDLTSGD